MSYYDYYQPEAYIAQTDTFIEKDSSINEEVERLRHSATNSLLTRRDTIVVASVSCIYGLGTPQEYVDRMVRIDVGDEVDRDKLLRQFVTIAQSFNPELVAIVDWCRRMTAVAITDFLDAEGQGQVSRYTGRSPRKPPPAPMGRIRVLSSDCSVTGLRQVADLHRASMAVPKLPSAGTCKGRLGPLCSPALVPAHAAMFS